MKIYFHVMKVYFQTLKIYFQGLKILFETGKIYFRNVYKQFLERSLAVCRTCLLGVAVGCLPLVFGFWPVCCCGGGKRYYYMYLHICAKKFPKKLPLFQKYLYLCTFKLNENNV